MGKQKIDISVFDEAVKKVDVSAFDEAVKKKEPSASSVEPSRTQPTQQEQRFELPSSSGKDTTERQGRLDVPDFGQIEEPSQSAAAIADDLGVTTQDLKITEVLQDPKAKQSNLGRPLPTSEQYKINGKPVYRDEMIDVIYNQVNKIQAGTVDIEISDDPELQSRLQRQIQSGSRGGDILESLGAGLVSTAQSLEGLPSLVAATIEEITGLPTTETSIAIQSRLNAMDLGRKAEEIREKTRAYEGNFLESLLNGNFVDAAAQGMNLTMESLPITAISAVTGGGGSIGSYLLRSAATLTPIMASREFSESQVSQDPDIQNLEQSQKVLRSWLYGGAEALGESVTGRIASKNFDILKGSLKSTVGRAAAEVGEDGARQTAKQIAKNTAIDIAKNMGVDMNQEGISEAVTEMTQMLTDDLMGVKSYSFGDYAEQMSNAYASGAFMGAVMGLGGAVGVSADAVKKYRSTTYQNIAKGLERSVANGEITEVEANAVKADAAAISQTNPTLSDKAQAAQASLIKERNGLEQFLEGVDKAAAPKEYERINQINQELTKIAENDETSKEDQELLEAEIREEIEQEKLREEVKTRDVADEKAVLEELSDDRIQEEGEQESPELRTETQEELDVQEQEKIAESIGRFRRVKPKNIRGLLDVMGGIFGLNKPQAESAAVVGDVMVEAMAKRAGVSKDEMYQRIAFQKAEKAPDGSLRQEQPTFKSTAKEGLANIQQAAATPEQWVKQIGEKGGKGTTQELEWIGLQDYLNEWKKENNAKSVPKEVVEQYINDNQIEIVEVSKGRVTKSDKFDIQYNNGVFTVTRNGIEEKSFTDEFLANNYIANQQLEKEKKEPKYSQYTLEGGENYQEVLLTLPQSKQDKARIVELNSEKNELDLEYNKIYDKDIRDVENQIIAILEEYKAKEGVTPSIPSLESRGDSRARKLDNKKRELQNKADAILRKQNEITAEVNRIKTNDSYKSSHWDEANILAHLRINERTLPNGERVMFIEEVQSDWAQEGKKKGFNIPNKERVKTKEEVKAEELKIDEDAKRLNLPTNVPELERIGTPEALNLIDRINQNIDDFLRLDNANWRNEGKIPNMPYKKTDQWVGMAMRRALKMAADEGFDRVAWVTGEQSADRYDLSKQISQASAIKNDDGTYNLVLEDTRGNELPEYRASGKKMTPSEMEDTIGKELAQKLIEGADRNKGREWKNQPTNPEFFTLRGDGLKVGGEGMKAFYNSILPKVAGKEAKRFDKRAKVEVVDFGDNTRKVVVDVQRDGSIRLINEGGGFIAEYNKNQFEEAYREADRLNERIDNSQVVGEQLSIPITPEMRMNLNRAVPLFQGEQGAMLAQDGNYIIYALTDPNVSTPLHELAHVYEHYLSDAERSEILAWAQTDTWTTETSEKFARGFEKYLSEGKAPVSTLQKYFDNFKNWLLEIYNGIVGSDIDIELNAPMRKIYDNMFSQVRGEKIVAGDKVTVTYEDYVRGKKTKKQRRGVIDSVNPDGSFNIRAREGVYKNISPEGVSKVKSTPTVESETQGLTEKERFVQGFKEIMSAKDEKIRQAKEAVKEKLSQARAKFGERMSAQRKKVSEAKTARAELSRLIALEMKELGLSDVRASRVKSMLSSMKNITPNNIDSVIERAYGLVVAEAKAQRLNTYKKKSKEAKRRIQRGDFDTVSVGMIPLMELDVRAILDEDIKRYTELVDDFSRRGKFAVEDVAAKIQEANEIVNRAAEQLGLREVEASNIAQGLTEENYNETISNLVASGDITQDMADFMRANKKRLLELEKKPVNKEQVFFEIQDKVGFVKNNQQDLSGRPVKQKAQDVISSVKREDLENMSDADLSLLNRVLDAMEVGLMPSQASKLAQTIEAQRTANSINEQTKQERGLIGKLFDAIDTPIRELASGKAKRVRRQMIKSQSTTPDSSFGFKGKAISKALEPFNIAYGELEAQANKYKGMLARAIKNIKKSQASDIRGFLYMAEMHRNANPQSNKAYTVKQLIDVLTGTTEARETYISNYGKKRYKEILKTYDKFKDENGELDAKKLYESMSKAERDYVSTAEIIFSENTEFARDARWVRGESFEELNYYMHYPVVMQTSKSDVNASVDNMMNSGIVRPSTKAGNLEERTEGVKLVSFSLAESVQNSYQQTLEDYYLTQPLRTERKAFNMFEKMNSNNDKMFSFASGVNKGAEDFRRYLLASKQVSNFNNPITNAIKAGAYRYMLGSTARAVKEVLSNQSYVAMSDLVNFETASFKSFEIAKKTLAEPDWLFKAVANLPISDKQRILGNAVFAGQADAATMLGEDVGFTARTQSLEARVGKGIEAMQDLGFTVNIKGNRIRISNKAYMEALLKTPDMFYSRGVFFDKLQRAYKKETGESLDLDKLTDKKFINDNRVLFDKITKEASAAVRKAFSTTNLAERSGVQLKASAEGGMFNAVKYFMLPFVINEYEQLRMAAVEDGLFGGLKTAIPILSRFAVYGALTGALTRAIAAALSDEDEPIEDILPSMDEFMKSLISSVVTLTLQRNWTFAPRAASNYVIEYLNKEFGEGITRESKEYDKFKDNIMFNRMNLDDVMGMRWTEMAQIIAPQYSPLLSSYEAAMKSTDERNKQRKEYLGWKALVTALAGLGFLLPRDVRDIYIYSNEDVRDLIFEDKKKGVSGTIKGGSSSRALSGGSGTTIKGSAR